MVGIYYNSINPLMGASRFKSFICFGGIDHSGAMIGGYFIGIVEVLVAGYSTCTETALCCHLILVLIIKPAGLLGKNTREKV